MSTSKAHSALWDALSAIVESGALKAFHASNTDAMHDRAVNALDLAAAERAAGNGNGRITVTVHHGEHRHDDDIGLDNARQWAANRLAECGEIELPADDSDPDPSGIDDATVVQMVADDIGANLDYEKLR